MTLAIVPISRIKRHRDPDIGFSRLYFQDADNGMGSRIKIDGASQNMRIAPESPRPKPATYDDNVRSACLRLFRCDPSAKLRPDA